MTPSRTFVQPFLYALAAFAGVVIITFIIAGQQLEFQDKKDQEDLNRELNYVKDRFRNILYSDITAANAMGVIYKEYGTPKNFDSIAAQIIRNNQYAEVLQLTVDGVITNVYPVKGYEKTIGINTLADSTRIREAKRATEKKEIFFAGPRQLRMGGIGILGKVPIIINNRSNALIVVLTKMETIGKGLGIDKTSQNKFAYELVKKSPGTDTAHYFLSAARPTNRFNPAATEISEGDWMLKVAYNTTYKGNSLPPVTCIMGGLLALILGLLVFRMANRPQKLKEIISAKTGALNERIKELSTIYQVNKILQHEELRDDEVFTEIVKILPTGWQYPEICEARILFEGNEFRTPAYKISSYAQSAAFKTESGMTGLIEVVYTEERMPEYEGVFLREERDLINTLAEMIQLWMNKKIQKASLVNSEAKFRGSFEYAAIGMATVNLDKKCMMVNKAMCDITGYSAEELLGKSFQEITHPDDVKNDLELIQKLIAGEIHYYRIGKRYIHKNGSIIRINATISVIRNQDGNPDYFVGQVENVTDKWESEQKFKNLVEKSLVGVYIIRDGMFAYVNPRVIEESGYTEQELLHLRIDSFIHEDHRKLVYDTIEARLKGEIEAIRYEVKARKKNGEIIWLEMLGSSTYYEGKLSLIGTMVNVTDKKRAHDELAKSEANLKSIFDNTAVSYLLLDTNYNILAQNQRFIDGWYEQVKIRIKPGDNFIDTIPRERTPRIKGAIDQVITMNKLVNYETYYKNEHDEKYFDVVISPVNTNGKVIGVIFSVVNITERKNMENERQKMLEERGVIIEDLTRRNRDLEQFSYIVSHNVRGPLTSILGLSNIATDLRFDAPTKTKAMEGIQLASKNLDTVLLDLNEILQVRRDLSEKKTDVDLNELVTSTRETLGRMITDSKTCIQTDFSQSPTICSIKSYMQNIVYNMITNSIKYARPGFEPHIEIWTEKKAEKVRLHFKDNGIGIDMEKHRESIFGLYKRFNLTVEGKGLGLFMVKTQTEAMNGKVEVESMPGGGTHFILSFKQD